MIRKGNCFLEEYIVKFNFKNRFGILDKDTLSVWIEFYESNPTPNVSHKKVEERMKKMSYQDLDIISIEPSVRN